MPGVDFDETFAPVARIGSIRMLMVLAAELDMQVQQLDFISAYLNGDIKETIYMEVRKHSEDILSKKERIEYKGNKVLKLQSGRECNKKLD